MPAIYPSNEGYVHYEYLHPWEKNAYFKPEPRRRKTCKKAETYPKNMSFWRLLDYHKFTDLPDDPDAIPPAPGCPPLERELPKDQYLYYVPKVLCRFNYGYKKSRIAKIPPLQNRRGLHFVQLTFGHPWGVPHNPLPTPLYTFRERKAQRLARRAARRAAKEIKKAQYMARKMAMFVKPEVYLKKLY